MHIQLKEGISLSFKFQSFRILIIILLLFVECLSAQPYQAVIHKDSTAWDVAQAELFGIIVGHIFCNSHQDSIYSSLYHYGIYPGETYFGKVREDSTTGRIWYVDVYGNPERLIMDMNLSLGDTFQIFPFYYSTVDSVYYQDGRKNIRFDLPTTRWGEAVRFIEGVGPNTSITYPFSDYDGLFVTCKYDQDSLVYVNNNPKFIGCLPDLTGIDETTTNTKVKFFPNPVVNILNIELDEAYHYSSDFNVSDLTGRKIMGQTLVGYKHTISLSKLSQGIYIITIINGMQSYHHKVIKVNYFH